MLRQEVPALAHPVWRQQADEQIPKGCMGFSQRLWPHSPELVGKAVLSSGCAQQY